MRKAAKNRMHSGVVLRMLACAAVRCTACQSICHMHAPSMFLCADAELPEPPKTPRRPLWWDAPTLSHDVAPTGDGTLPFASAGDTILLAVLLLAAD